MHTVVFVGVLVSALLTLEGVAARPVIEPADGGGAIHARSRLVDIVANSSLGTNVFSFRLAGGGIVVRSNKDRNELTIRSTVPVGSIMLDHRVDMLRIAKGVFDDPSIDTETPGTVTYELPRISNHLAEWPKSLAVEYTYDPVKEMERHRRRDSLVEQAVERATTRGKTTRCKNVRDDTSLCSVVTATSSDFLVATHDGYASYCWGLPCDPLDNGDDRSTYCAWAHHNPSFPCAEGTKYWNPSARTWECYGSEPDHSPDIEFAYGSCFGRCGAGCGPSSQYTKDCLDHDSCVRFGHDLASLWCDDEFAFTTDDVLWAPNCFPEGTPPVEPFDPKQ